MADKWRRQIEHRNLRELIAAAIGAVAIVFLGSTLRAVPLVCALIWIGWTIAREGRWQARSEDGVAGARRELVRQGRFLQRAWHWYVLPIAIGLLFFGVRGVMVPVLVVGSAAISALNFVAGQKLIRESRRL
jgi:hypothetical protein